MKEKLKALIEEFKEENNKEVIKINLISNTKVSLTSSNIAGWFYLPKSRNIPVNDKGEQLMFLAQINCEELPENNIYPKKGIMEFWIFGGDYDMGDDYENPTSDKNKRVIYYPTVEEHFNEEELIKMYKPKSDNGELITPICDGEPFALSFEKCRQWALISDFRFDELFIAKWNKYNPDKHLEAFYELYDIDENLFEDIITELNFDSYTQLGGYGYFTQTDPRNYDNLKDYTELLFQLDSEFGDEDYEILWGDCGVGNFFATEEQMKNLDFANCVYSWDCC